MIVALPGLFSYLFDLDQVAPIRGLCCVNNVCGGVSVRIFMVNMEFYLPSSLIY